MQRSGLIRATAGAIDGPWAALLRAAPAWPTAQPWAPTRRA